MRLIYADELENEVVKRAFEGKTLWSVNELKQLIRKQKDAPVQKIMDAFNEQVVKVQERWKNGRW